MASRFVNNCRGKTGILSITLMASRFVNNCSGKTGILSITFAKREQYSQILRDTYITILGAQKLSTL
jgi:hypothetical protein